MTVEDKATDDVQIAREQEKLLVFERFDEDVAFHLGLAARELALRVQGGASIDIRLWDRPLFHSSLPGSVDIFALFALKKSNTVRRFGKSSFLVMMEDALDNREFPLGYGLSLEEFALIAGGFPILLRGIGPIGSIALSGFQERVDHNIAVQALAAVQRQDLQGLLLPEP